MSRPIHRFLGSGEALARLQSHAARLQRLQGALEAALPPQLAYIRSGHVPVLLAQQCFEWGKRSVELLVDKILFKKDPPAQKEISALIPVTKDNVDAFAKNWEVWLPK